MLHGDEIEKHGPYLIRTIMIYVYGAAGSS